MMKILLFKTNFYFYLFVDPMKIVVYNLYTEGTHKLPLVLSLQRQEYPLYSVLSLFIVYSFIVYLYSCFGFQLCTIILFSLTHWWNRFLGTSVSGSIIDSEDCLWTSVFRLSEDVFGYRLFTVQKHLHFYKVQTYKKGG